MNAELEKELKEITRAQSPESFRRDRYLIPTAEYQLKRINRQLYELSKNSLCKKQAE